MARQKVDTVTKEMPLVQQWQKVLDAREQITEVINLLDYLNQEYNKLMTRHDELIAAGVDYAGTWFKDDKFLYLVYPDKGEGRRRVYVGADQTKQNEALDRLRRGREVDEIKQKIQKLTGKVDHIQYKLKGAINGW
jgi:hypothetical protein